ncbi:hypothetical protein [Alicyclobacillus sp. ALC3]|uniref:hypothetical protein n=1 Tax=Alicyclobacillus sp. ALC3 TaxID=2796143 RepID=UPI00237925B4|nr:hypothetical protein [Alicyclobacillus sp. ALC3]WDL96387.1 hypothetical protein JC200_18985 [Alicyclobacillus sp. ALC3]
MQRRIYVAGINTRKLRDAADSVPYWLLSATLLRQKHGLPSWLVSHLENRVLMWDPGTFTEDCISYHGYRAFIDRWARSRDEYLQYDEIGDPDATAFYLHDMRKRGYDPIPVLQPGGDASILSEPRAAIGGTVPMGADDRAAYLDELFYHSGVAITGRIHLLGMWRPEWFRPYFAGSGDSTTWIPRAPYNRQMSIPEWLEQYGEQNIPYVRRDSIQQRLVI